MTGTLADYALTVPLNTITAFGLGAGPTTGSGTPERRLEGMRSSLQGLWNALETIGITGRSMVALLVATQGQLTGAQLAFQTAGASDGVIEQALERLRIAGAITRSSDGGVRLVPSLQDVIVTTTRSLAEQGGPLTETLALACRNLRLQGGTRKQERVDAIAVAFADSKSAAVIRSTLSADALDLLDKIAIASGPGTCSSVEVGLPTYLLRFARSHRYAYQTSRVVPPEVAALDELARVAIVGVSEYEDELWIWREAWPLTGRPYISSWQVASRPSVVQVASAPTVAVPAIVAKVDQLLRSCATEPSVALKNDDARLSKPQVRSRAKQLGCDEMTIDLGARLAISMGLMLRNVAGRSGRGRNQVVEYIWMPDPEVMAAWATLPPRRRWARLVSEWCRPRSSPGHQLLANRHLLLWELSLLDDSSAYLDDGEFSAWFVDRYASLAHPDAVQESIADLRALGVVAPDCVALTTLGRQVLTDPSGVADSTVASPTTAYVQSDLTVIAPADLRHDLAAMLERIATVESSSSTITYRLDVARITRAAQAEDTAESIIGMLQSLSPSPLPDSVTRLVADAARKSGAIQLIHAPTVLVVNDPVDLATALAMKSLKLTRISDTVATTALPIAKARDALAKKGLVAQVIGGAPAPTAARSSVSDAAVIERQVEQFREMANRSPEWAAHTKALKARAEELKDVGARFAIAEPIAVTASLVATLGAVKKKGR